MPQSFIRPARSSDGLALGTLDHDTWSPVHAVLPRPEPGRNPFAGTIGPEGMLVAEDPDGTLVGYIRVVPPTSLPCNRHVRQIQGLAVAEGARGRGIGRALLRAGCDEARSQGATRITLRVLGHNKPAQALYESEGFVVEGVLPGELYLQGTYVDDVLMGRSLIG